MDSITQALEEATQQLVALGNSLFIIIAVIAIAPYILFAIGLSSAAKRCRIRNSWMAWLPIARKHLLAEVADIRRVQAGKEKKLATQFEVSTFLLVLCLIGISRINTPILLIIPIVLIIFLSINQIFCYYYFYRLRDRENATIFFLLGLIAKPLNSFFVYHCR